MSTWRDRLCGSIALNQSKDQQTSMESIKNPSQTLCCGGGHFPEDKKMLVSPYKGNFFLPTKAYSVLVFKTDGTAVIYSDSEAPLTDEPTQQETDNSYS